MSMYFCNQAQAVTARIRKEIREALKPMFDAIGLVFVDGQDVEILCIQTKRDLRGSVSGIDVPVLRISRSEYGIQVVCYRDESMNKAIAIFDFQAVRGFTTYDLDEKRFIEVKLKMEEKQSCTPST